MTRRSRLAAPLCGLALAADGIAELIMLLTGHRLSYTAQITLTIALVISGAFVFVTAVANLGLRTLLVKLLREPVQPSPRDDARIPRQPAR